MFVCLSVRDLLPAYLNSPTYLSTHPFIHLSIHPSISPMLTILPPFCWKRADRWYPYNTLAPMKRRNHGSDSIAPKRP